MFLKSAVVFSGLVVGSLSFASNERLVPSPTEKLFVPLGFDDNDNVEVVVHGHFLNSCYKTGPSIVETDVQNKIIRVLPQSYEYQNALCAQVLVPFMQEIKIGTLAHGEYKVIVGNRSDVEPKTLSVKPRTTESPDDYLYAPVDDARLNTNDQKGQSLTVSGRYPMTLVGCAMVTDVKSIQTPGEVLLVLPVMELLTDENECAARKWTPKFSITKKLDSNLKAGDYLMHVRVLNGNSFNKIETVSE